MRIYLDDDIVGHKLVSLLRKAGHDVVLPTEVGMAAAKDPRHLAYTTRNNLVLLTRNHTDFEDLHKLVAVTKGVHQGIMLVLADDNPKHKLTLHDIVAAIAKLEASGVPLVNELHVLNHWR